MNEVDVNNMTIKLNVFSAFDGIGSVWDALNRVDLKLNNGFSSEIDKYASAVRAYHHPCIVELGDISQIDSKELGDIDLMIGGSPCQDFSFAGKGAGLDGDRSGLMLDMLRLRDELKPKYFLFENVNMKKEHLDIVNELMGVEPIVINSSLVSAQNRKRLYWTNIPNVVIPDDKHITWGDIREYDAPSCHYYSKAGLSWIERHSKKNNKKLRIWDNDEKIQMLEMSMYKNYSSQRFFGIEDIYGLRYISLLECERAQTYPDNYTLVPDPVRKNKMISNTQRYKMCGNGFTTGVIAHILSFIK